MPDVGYLPEARPTIAAHRGGTAARVILAGAIIAGAVLAVIATPMAEATQAAQAAGMELTRLLQAMAGLKLLFAAGLLAVIYWRLALPISAWCLISYAGAAAAMAAGPVLIWDMVHVRLGALLLHGGLLAGALLLWRDPAVGPRLADLVARRRATLHAHGGARQK